MRMKLLLLLLLALPSLSSAQSLKATYHPGRWVRAPMMMMYFFPPSVDLTWTPSTTSGVTSQKLQRGTTSGGPYTDLQTFNDNTTSAFTDLTVTNNTTYYYVAVALKGTSTSGPSNQATAAVAEPNAPSGLTALPH